MVSQYWFLSIFFIPLTLYYVGIFITAVVVSIQKIKEKSYNYALTATIFIAAASFFKFMAHALSSWDFFEGYLTPLTNARVFFALLIAMMTTCLVFDIVMLSW